MQDVLVIHGGNSFASESEYLDWLHGKQFTRESMLGADWKAGLQTALGDGFTVFTPRMPNPQNARFDEWATWFEKMLACMNPGVILVGHSLGGIFLSKYLATRELAVPTKAAFLVAPLFAAEGEGVAPSFALPGDLSRITAQVPFVRMYHSTDDMVVPFEHMGRYQALLPSMEAVELQGMGHCNMPEFPMIVEDIRAAAVKG